MHDNSAGMDKPALESEFNSAGMGKPAMESKFNIAGCIITALIWVNHRWKANLTALDAL